MGLIEMYAGFFDIVNIAALLVVSFSTLQVFPGSWWATGFILLSSGRCQRSKHELTQKRTA